MGLVRPPRPGPCLDFGFQYVLIKKSGQKNWGRVLGLVWLKLVKFTAAPLPLIQHGLLFTKMFDILEKNLGFSSF